MNGVSLGHVSLHANALAAPLCKSLLAKVSAKQINANE